MQYGCTNSKNIPGYSTWWVILNLFHYETLRVQRRDIKSCLEIYLIIIKVGRLVKVTLTAIRKLLVKC